MNFNCLAVDVRNGGNSNVLGNETANRCRSEGLDRGADAIEEDIIAAVNYASEKSGQKVILLGAGANGSLALKIAKEQDEVRGVIALSPGEFFLPGLSIEDTIAGLQKPVLITSSKLEFPYSKQLVSKIAEDNKSVFTPEQDQGARGTRALLPDNSSNGEYWLAILFFFKDLQ
jgi:3-dehydroquinate dehydratase